MSSQPVLLIHGGAGSKILTAGQAARIQESLRTILEHCQINVRKRRSALELVTEAARLLENDGLYNAGYGSKIQSDGKIRMSAAVMDGHRRRFGGCVNVEGVRNPILLARCLLTSEDRVLSGLGARRYAKKMGLKFSSPYSPNAMKEYRSRTRGKTGTIGAIALDSKGHLAAATSTGGRGFEFPYRVSDSPTVAGNYANEIAAVSATGIGEEIVESAAAATICALVESGWTLRRAVDHVLHKSKKLGGSFGVIALDRKGHAVARTNTRLLIWGLATKNEIQLMGRKP
jgi:L-asparaginase